MSSRSFARKVLACASVLTLPLTGGCSSGPTAPSSSVMSSSVSSPSASPEPVAWKSAMPEGHTEWRRAMAKMGTPHAGCFHATHPSTTWEEVPCGVAPSTPLAPPKPGGGSAGPLQVGNGVGDFAAAVPSPITWAEGSFPVVSGATKLAAFGPNSPAVGATFSLQLNTNSPTGVAPCTTAPNSAKCTVWQQYAYSNGQIFIQHWLINYGNAPNQCPTGYTNYDNGHYVGINNTEVPQYDCYSNKLPIDVPVLQVSDLPYVGLEGTAGTNDELYLYDYVNGHGEMWNTSDASVLHADQWWKSAEFNAFGPGYGSAVVFNYGTTMGVETLTAGNAVQVAPTCTNTSYTGESNNLTVVPGSCCGFSDVNHGTGIFFTQSNLPGAAKYTCP